MRRLSIIGEAVRFVTEDTRTKLPQLPWNEMAKMRNVLVHVYFGVRLDLVWSTAINEMTPLIVALEGLLPPAP